MSPILGIMASGVNVAGGAFESIATAAGTGNSGTITFSSIPQTFTHLQVRWIGKSAITSTANAYTLYLRFNDDSGSNYAYHSLSGDGATVTAAGSATQTRLYTGTAVAPNSNTNLANMAGVGIIDIHDYTSTSKNKTVRMFCGKDLNRTTAPVGTIELSSGLWMSTSAITTITIANNTTNWTTASSFALYGIKG